MAKRTSRPKARTKKVAKAAPEKVGVIFEAVRVASFLCGDRPDDAPDEVMYGTEVLYEFDAEKPAFVVTVKIEAKGDYGDRELPAILKDVDGMLFAIVVRCLFRLSNLEHLERLDDGSVHMPGWVLASIVSGSVGTARGVLTQKLAGSAFARLVPPLLSLNELLPADIARDVASHGI